MSTLEIKPITLADLPEDWIEERREVIAREGNAVRLSTDSLNIEVKSLRIDRWLRLGLPGAAPEFASHKEREFVLREIQRAEARPKKEAAK
jgi:hypothetical protein